MPIYNPTFIQNAALGRNRVLNGAMNIDQNKEGGTYTSTSAEFYTLDNMRIAGAGATGVFSAARNPSSTSPGFSNSLQFTVQTSQAVLAATDNFHLEIPIEGRMIQDFQFGTSGAVTTTVSFWTFASTAGTYSFAYMNGGNTRSYVTTFVINSANTWEKKTIIIPGDTTGTWTITDNTFGLKCIWSLGVGSTFSTATSETWQSTATWNKTGSAQFIQQAAANVYLLTGIQVEIGSVATPYEYVDPSVELLRLQRYYYKTFPNGTAVAQSAGVNGALTYITKLAGVNGDGVMLKYPVSMAGTPTLITYNPSAAAATWRNQSNASNSGTPTLFNSTADGTFAYNPQVIGDTLGALEVLHLTANARLGGS